MSKSNKQKALAKVYPDVNEIPPLPSPVADGHTHLDLGTSDFAETPLTVAEVLQSGQTAGVPKLIQAGTGLESSQYSATLAAENDNIIAAIGIHPNETPGLIKDGLFDSQIEEIDHIAKSNSKVRGIGETGLDFFRTPELDDQHLQKQAFIKHIELAKELDLAMQIHDREAHKDIIDTLNQQGAPAKTVFHCFSGDAQMAEYVAKQGWYLSFAGNITFKANCELRDALTAAPLDKILVETDAPFLTPAPFRGRPNISYLTAVTVRYMAEFLHIDLQEFCEILMDNFYTVYGKW